MAKRERRDKGEGALYQRTRDGMWVGTVELPMGADGKRRRKVVTSKDYAVAVKKLRALRRQVEDAGGDIPTANTTVTKWLTTWLDNIVKPKVRPNTFEQYASDVRLHIEPVVGRHRLDRLTPAHVRAMNTAIIGKGRSSTTALRCHAVLSKALKDAMREGLVHRNVAELVDRPRPAKNDRGALTSAQAVALLRHHQENGPLASRLAASLLTGARQGELIGLQRDRITDVLDLSWQLQRLPYEHGCGGTCGKKQAGACPQKRFRVPHGFEHRPLHGALCLTRPKSAAGTRIVPLVEPFASILTRHLAATDGGPHGLVWTAGDGKPIDPARDSETWRDAVAAANLPPVPLHAARHTTATLLLEVGVPQQVVMAILGHSSVAATRGYQHASQELTRQALTRLGGLFELGR